jgi:hypothetical protein
VHQTDESFSGLVKFPRDVFLCFTQQVQVAGLIFLNRLTRRLVYYQQMIVEIEYLHARSDCRLQTATVIRQPE